MQLASNNMNIATQKIREAMDATEGYVIEIPAGKTSMIIDLCQCPKEFLQNLLLKDLSKIQRAQISAQLGDKTKVLKEAVKTTSSLYKLLMTLSQPGEPTIEIQVGGRWYPVPVQTVQHQPASYHSDDHVSLSASAKVCDQTVGLHAHWSSRDFRDDNGNQVEKTVGELLEAEGIRIASAEAIAELREKNAKAEKLASQTGKVMVTEGAVLAINKLLWRSQLEALPLGSKGKPRQLIVEEELEQGNNGHHGGYYGGNTEFKLPFVRAFSLDFKKYVYTDIDDVQEYKFDGGAKDRLVLPEKMRSILDQIFATSTDEIFGDLFKGRHGGMILLANGPQGTGKTLTAEVFAEHTKRPLYVLEMGELGTNLATVEESLQKVFARAARWNAVLLFDEADVFLAKREETDLERSAIVGVFLRLLDRYEGMFFLTTNRAEVIDPAFRSRITLKLDYPALDQTARTTVWKNMLEGAGFTLEGGIDKIAEETLDGRQIRNQVRLLKVLYKNGTVTESQILEILQYVAKN